MECLESDVVVIGGGIAGSFTALRLAQKGKSVCLLDKGRLFGEASGRNGGGVRQQFRKPAELPLAIKAVEIWAGLTEEMGRDLEYQRSGSIRLIRSEEDLTPVHERVAREKDLGIDVTFWEPGQVRARIPSLARELDLVGATYCATDGTANPLLLGRALAGALAGAGVDVYQDEPVTRLVVENGRVVRADSDQRQYTARDFVVEAGPWSREICQTVGADFPIAIRRSQLIVSEPISPVIPGFISFNNGYMRQARDGNLHMGVRGESLQVPDKRSTLAAFTHVGRYFTEVFPFIRNTTIIRGFAGITTWTPDGTPIIDRAPGLEGLYVATGFSGHGFCLGPVVGELMSQWLVEGERPVDLSAFAWTRFNEKKTTAE